MGDPIDHERDRFQGLNREFGRLFQADLESAQAKAQEALVDATARSHVQDQGIAHYMIGIAHRAAGDLEQAESHLRSAVRLFESERLPGVATCLMFLSDISMLRGDYQEAKAQVWEARRMQLRVGDRLGAARSLNSIGNLLHRRDDNVSARRALEKARRECEGLPDAARLAAVIDSNLASTLAALCETQKAEELYVRSRNEFRRIEQGLLEAQVAYNHAHSLYQWGRWQESFELFQELGPVFEKLKDRRYTGQVDLGLAHLSMELHLDDDAKRHAEAAKAIFNEIGMPYESAKCEIVQGTLLTRRGSFGRALTAYRRAQRDFEKEGNRTWQALCLLRMGGVELLQGKPDLARATARRAAELVKGLGAAIVQVQAHELAAQAALCEGDLEPAMHSSQEAARALDRSPMPWMRESIWHTRGLIHRARGSRGPARQAFERAVEAVERGRRLVSSDDIAVAFQGSRVAIYEDLIAFHLEGGRPSDRASAFEVAGCAKAAALSRLLRGRSLGESGGGSVRIAKTRERLQLLYRRLADVGDPGVTGDEDEASRFSSLLDRARQEEDRLTSYLRAHPESRGAGAQRSDLDTLWRRLKKDETLLEFCVVGERLVAFVVRKQKLDVVSLQTSVTAIAKQIRLLQFQIERPGDLAETSPVLPEALRRGLGDLYDALIRPVQPFVSSGGLLIVPSGPLHAVPFAALRDGDAFLVDRHVVSILPVRTLVSARSSAIPEGGHVLFGLEAKEIPAVSRELAEVETFLGDVTVRAGDEATVAAFHELAPRALFLHVATHAEFRRDNPMFSRLCFADGGVAAWELARIPMRARVVVLSACTTGRVEPRAGDEILGLSRGLLAAGVKTLVLSHWRVSDEITASLMSGLHRGLAAGQSVTEALHGAMLEVRKQHPHPYYWASFQVVGDPRTRLRRRS